MPNANEPADAFNISRMHCELGIFKLSGHWQTDRQEPATIDVQQLHMMASDGWEALNLEADNTQQLVQLLLPEIRQHLGNQHKD